MVAYIDQGIIFYALPTLMNAYTNLSIYSSVWAALNYTLTRAYPLGTTGKLKPIT